MLPFVSFVTATYARPPLRLRLLDELVYWFTRQDYPADRRELLILNDAPGQELTCPVPGVRVVNAPARYPTLGDKLNALSDLAAGEVILPQDDDDVPLPHRARQAVERLGGADYWNPQASWYEDAAGLHADHAHGVCHNAGAFRAGKLRYPPVSGSQDAAADAWAKAHLRVSPAVLSAPAEWSYVYRWGVSDVHLSGFRDPEAAYSSVPAPVPGRYRITPRMGRDYVLLTRATDKTPT